MSAYNGSKCTDKVQSSSYAVGQARKLKGSEAQMREHGIFRLASVALVSLGVGILLSFFVPAGALVVIEALLIVTVGCMTLLKH